MKREGEGLEKPSPCGPQSSQKENNTMTDKPSQWTIYDRILADLEALRHLNRERIASFERNHGKKRPPIQPAKTVRIRGGTK